MNKLLLKPAAKVLLFGLLLAPVVALVVGAFTNQLGANPAERLIRETGEWTLRWLCLTLAVTPARQLTGWHALARFRRMLGVGTFAYGALHFLAYGWLDMGLAPYDIWRDILKRPFILVGTAALLLMLPLAATSFNRAIQALGAKRWQTLHRSVYAVAGLALLHFFWMRSAKQNFTEVAVYAAIVAALLGWRVWKRVQQRRQQRLLKPAGGSTPA